MIDFKTEKLIPLCKKFDLLIDSSVCEKLNIYGNLLLEWNEKINLTAIKEPEDVLYKHFYDCLLFFKNVNIPMKAKIIDVGTGAGFPGMVLKIVRPDIELTLLDSLNKRLLFLNEVLSVLQLNAQLLHLRAEEAGKNEKYREKYDIACARAVAPLPVLCEYCIPLVKKNGLFVSMKGPAAEEETAAAANAIKTLGGEKPNIICETLTGNEERNFIIIKKISQTPPKYPRAYGKIAKSAL